jgi:uncharacterized protein
LVSTYEVDRQGERVVRGAFKNTLERWRQSDRMVPVLSDHDGKVGAVVGHIDPRLTVETEQALEAAGTLDLSTALGRRVYQLVKKGSLSWSIGFVVPEGGRRRRNKITEITEVDLAEVSVVATPANRGARTLSINSLDGLQGICPLCHQAKTADENRRRQARR